MNVLWITPEIPIPADNGHRVVYHNRIAGLSSLGHSIYLYTFVEDECEFGSRRSLLAYCREVSLFRRERARTRRSLSKFLPVYIVKRRCERLRSEVNRCLQEKPIDVLLIDSVSMAQYRPRTIGAGILTVLCVHNIDHLLFWRSALAQRDLRRKLFLLSEAVKTFAYERRIYGDNTFDLFSFVSSTEREHIVDRYPAVKAIHSPIGVSDHGSSATGEAGSKPLKTILFVGNLSYFSNIEGISWYVRKVHPEVLKHCNNVRLVIAGKQPGSQIHQLASTARNIEVVGDVPSTIPLIRQADIVIAPMISGAGVKVKILEALSARRIVVTTRMGVDGTDLLDGKHLFVVDNLDHRGFALKCLEILRQEESYQSIAQTGYEYVTRRYSWNRTVKAFNDEIMTALRHKIEILPNSYMTMEEF